MTTTDISTRRPLPRLANLADAISLALLACALVPAVFHGGVHARALGWRFLSLTSAFRPLLAATLLILVRHLIVGRDNLWLRCVRRLGLAWDNWPPSPRAARQMTVAGVALLMLVLSGQAVPLRTGDGAEYMAMARNLARLRPPALTLEEIVSLRQPFWLENVNYPDLLASGVQGPDGRYDFPHFWLYSLLASPFVGAAELVGLHPNYGFLALNLVCLLAAVFLAIPRIGAWAALLLATGPLAWWIDKAHTEIFVFSALAIALALLASWPGVSLLMLGALVAQVPALAPVACVMFVWAVARGAGRSGRFWLGVLGGAAIAALHPIYYLLHLGILSPMAAVTWRQWPGWTMFTSVVWDPNIGLLPNHPALTCAGVAALAALAWRAPRRLLGADLLLIVFAGVVALFAFTQTPNVNHGATVSVSRYGVWAIPLAVPLFVQLRQATPNRTPAWLPALAAVSILWAVVVYPPARPGDYLSPTPLANWLWTKAPGLDNPLPEIFCERVEHREWHTLPAATAGCEKILVAGEGGAVTWPSRCPPAPVPDVCRARNALCYANKAGVGYAFRPAPRQPGFDWRVGPGLRQAGP